MIGILIIALLWVLFKTKNNIIRVVIVLFFILWQGVPAFNKWRADKLVDELCAKDGGVKVYETVTLPKERFNEWGRIDISFKSYMKSNDEYYSVNEGSDIQGNSNSDNIATLSVFKHRFSIYRASDHKLLGESITYARRGGDFFGHWWMPSVHSCPSGKVINLDEQIFLKSSN